MSGEPQLERSVLEGKERDKLQAIAEALGLKPSARAKKADLIDGILRATGVEAAPAAEPEPKPRRTVRKRVAEAAEVPDGPDQGVLATMATSPEGGQPADGIPQPGAEAVAEADAVDEVASGVARRLPPAEVEPAGSGGREEPAGSGGREEPAGSGGREEPAGSGGRAEPAGPGGNGGVAPRVGRDGSGPQAKPQPQAQQVQSARSLPPPGPPGPGNHAAPPPANQSQPAPAGSGQAAQPGQAAPAEGGEVRRNRRRRGRDRDRLGTGYDQQVQQADQAYSGDPLPCDGLLELRPEGFGFLRTSGYQTGPDDVYVSTSQIRKFALRAGDRIVGASRPATTQERFGALLRIDAVGDQSPDQARRRPRFEDLTPVLPDERLTLELADPDDPAALTARFIDLLVPLGKGQRVLIVAPPRAGRTTVLQHVARAIAVNQPDVDLMVVLVDERPEEVTELHRTLKGEVIGSTFDRPAEEHTSLAELAIEVAKRRVESGRDVVVILDGLTRLARANNLSQPPTGRVVAGNLDAGALHSAKRLFGAGRNLEEGGSLTIVATVLSETGSPADTAIFDELTGAANAELRLDRQLAEQRIYPAVDVEASSTGQEERLVDDDQRQLLRQLRRELHALARDGSGASAYDVLLDKLTRSKTNADLLADLARAPA